MLSSEAIVIYMRNTVLIGTVGNALSFVFVGSSLMTRKLTCFFVAKLYFNCHGRIKLPLARGVN